MLEGKVALVTGAAQGIGKAVAEKLSDAGAQVIIADRMAEEAGKTADELNQKHRNAFAVSVDVADSSSVEEMVKKVLDKFTRIDILINNAGITRDNLIIRMSVDEWRSVLAVNLEGAFHCLRNVLPHMVKQRWGRIVNISSVVGLMGNAGQSNYAASKAGLIGLTMSLAKEYAKRNITVNAVAPGFIRTRMTDVLADDVKNAMKKQIPMDRLGEPGDVADACVFLVSPHAAYITGQVLRVDGGIMM